MTNPLRVLAIEPFYGGSHQAFLDGWVQRSRHDWTLLTYSAHHWKWRMRHAACTAATQVRQWLDEGRQWDLIFSSDMLNLAEFRGLCPQPAAQLPAVVYFHENQLTYPVRRPSERDFHFVVSNFHSALAAEQVWFNSAFHRDEFLGALPSFWSQLPDHRPLQELATLAAKSRVQWPGIDLAELSKPRPGVKSTDDARTRSARICWAARWEFDKNPEAFFAALEHPRLAALDWRLSVLGQSFRETPSCFQTAREKWDERIDRWGFQASRTDYVQALQDCDVFVSTANHEFFGIGVVEAISAGAVPLLPKRLAYPELLNPESLNSESLNSELPGRKENSLLADCFFNDDEDLPVALENLLRRSDRVELQSAAAQQVARFDWKVRAPAMDDALEDAAT